MPTAAPGEALIPVVIRRTSRAGVEAREHQLGELAPVTRVSASSMSIRPWSTSWVAIRNAAPAVRFPTRVCSIQSLPRSIVNSMSHRSR